MSTGLIAGRSLDELRDPDMDDDSIDDEEAFNSEDEKLYGHFFKKKKSKKGGEQQEEEEEEEEEDGNDDHDDDQEEEQDDDDDDDDDDNDDDGDEDDDGEWSSDDEDDDSGSDAGAGASRSLGVAARRQRDIMADRASQLRRAAADGSLEKQKLMHTDDLSSDDEAATNTVGNVPMEWYEEHDHVGYDVSGKPIIRQSRGDGLDRYLASQDDPNYGRTVYDEKMGRDVVLTDRQLTVVRRMLKGKFAHPEFNPYPEYIDFNTHKKRIHALGNDYVPKSHFTPSKWEQHQIMKIVKGIKDGTILMKKDREAKKEAKEDDEVYLLWGEDDTTGDQVRAFHRLICLVWLTAAEMSCCRGSENRMDQPLRRT